MARSADTRAGARARSATHGIRWLPFRRDECAAAAVELALVAPILFLLIFGIVEFGITAWRWNTVTDAARIATRLAIVGSSTSGQALTPGQLRDTVRLLMADNDLTVSREYWNAAGTAASGSNVVGDRARVTVSRPLTSVTGLFAGLAGMNTISSRSEMVITF